MEHAEQLIEAQELVAAGQWEQARQRLAGLLAVQESPEAHDGMGAALWWLCRVRESLDHRERAYAGYLAEHRHIEAAIVALDISVCHLTNLTIRSPRKVGSPGPAGWRSSPATTSSTDGCG